MKKGKTFFCLAVLIVLLSAGNCFTEELVWEDIGRGNTNFTTVLIDPDNPHIIYAGSGNSIIKSEDGAKTWRVVLNIKSQGEGVNSIVFDSQDKNCLYAATGNGLYFSSDKAKNWKRIFQGKGSLEKDCTRLAVLPTGIYLGTKQGFFVSQDKGRTWHKQLAQVGNSQVFAIAYNLKEPGLIYLACVSGVFKSEDCAKSWEKVFVVLPVEDGNDSEEINDDSDKDLLLSSIRYITIDHNKLNNIYLATSKGVLKSQDKGKSWESISNYGLLSNDISFLLVTPLSSVFAVTKSGIFEYKDKRWHELSIQLASERIKYLSLDNENNIYAVCNNGLFKANLSGFSGTRENNLISIYCQDEPRINEVQIAAIKYAEVEPEKIQQWRNKAAKKALLPQVSVGLDRNVTDLLHWESGSTTKSDDDLLRKGNDCLEWDINLSWDLSQLIWSNDQTSIDVRSRLMVQLRDDILDAVTKLYFERLRVKMELDNIPIENRKQLFEKTLRFEELTASLDGLTGGYFSKKNPNTNVGIK
jgi:photosystem II stability/assembly factor-like uncharacterized protein